LQQIYATLFCFECQSLRNRILVATARAAGAILEEDPRVPNHLVRLRWARKAIADEAALRAAAGALFAGACTTAAVQLQGVEIEDDELEGIVAHLIDTVYAVPESLTTERA
jgi:hypothetical protein